MQTIIAWTRKFVDRERELSALQRMYSSEGFELVVVYGRRRVGKTALLKKFAENVKSLYYLCSRRSVEYNLRKFSEKICDYLGLPRVTFKSFREAFEALATRREKVVVVIDEFGYLIEADEGVLSDFQEIVDEVLKNTSIKLILCGSAVSMIETRVLGYGSPLYGRSTMHIKVKPLPFTSIFEWFPGISFEDAMKLYAVTGGVPKYLEFFRGESIEKEIVENFFDPYSFLYSDALNLLSEELRDPSTYIQVLEAIALGYTKVTEIASYAFIQAKDVYFYLKTLQSLDIVERMVPLLTPRKSKRGVYRIKDLYFRFWFRFISPYQSEIESYNPEPAIENFKANFNNYLAAAFEDLVMELLPKLKIINYTKAGKWWCRDVEIDLVAVNEQTSEALFAEVKWAANVDAEEVAENLLEKARHFKWRLNSRKENIAVFAKSFKRKVDEVRGRKVYCLDLKALERAVRECRE